MLIRVERAPVVNSRATAGLGRRATLKLYLDAAHAFLIQDQTAFIPLIESFLR